MSNPSVLIRMGAEDAEALAGWVRQQRAVRNTENELKRLKDVSKESNDQLLSGFLKTYTAAGIAQRAFSAVTSEIKRQFDELREMQRRADESAVTVEQAKARFRVQTMTEPLSDEQRADIEEGIVAQGVQYGYSPQRSIEAARELYSQGVTVDQLTGALDAVFQFARGQDRELSTDLVKSLVTQTRANDPAMLASSFKEAAQSFFGAFLKEPLQPQDLEAFARANVGLAAAGVDQQTQLAINSLTLKITSSAEQAATLSKLLAVRMQAPNDEAARAMESAGLSVTDVDLVGEDIQTALDRMGQAMERLPEEQRVPFVRDIFGSEYAGQFRTLIERRNQLPQTVESVRAGSHLLPTAVEQMMGTAQARTQTVEAEAERGRAESGSSAAEVVRSVIAAQQERLGIAGFNRWMEDTTLSLNQFDSSGKEIQSAVEQFEAALWSVYMNRGVYGENDSQERAAELYDKLFSGPGVNDAERQRAAELFEEEFGEAPPTPQAALPPPLPVPEPPAAPPAPAPGLGEQASAKLDATNELLSRLLDRFNSPLAVESLDIPAPNGVAYRSGPPLANA